MDQWLNADGCAGWTASGQKNGISMPEITGLHHIALPATDVLASGEWYERV
ncbi:VOC family protein [Streptosporangium sp. NPDC000396]|uniref:VOC family protein n=1 Tax=Streptosporangium sp. NPDC000396 TaxID=3366185 RepID=UPI0036A7D30C